MKKKYYLLMLLLAMAVAGLHAQKPLSKEAFREKQQAFITREARLSPEEAGKFFPLYFQLQDKKEQFNREAWHKQRKGKEPNTTETEYARIVEDVIKARISVDELELEYVKKYKHFLSARKIYEIQKAEMRFHRELLRMLPNRPERPERREK